MNLEDKIDDAKRIVKKTLEEYEKPVIGFTSGKDSTLVTWITKEVCEEEGMEKPDLLFIDHGQHFDQVREFGENLSEEWGFEVKRAINEAMTSYPEEADINILELPQQQIDELEAYNFIDNAEDSVKNSLNTKAGNHMLKTYPMEVFIEREGVDAMMNGIRRDEHDSRSDEEVFSERTDPDHTRVHPIIEFTEREVWDALWLEAADYDLLPEEDYLEGKDSDFVYGGEQFIPVNPLYFEGYRSLGSSTQTKKSSDKPAWLQDLSEGTERDGRAQDKDDEDAMKELRTKGYM